MARSGAIPPQPLVHCYKLVNPLNTVFLQIKGNNDMLYLKQNISALKRKALSQIGVWKPAGPNLTIRSTDTFIVSYPKSGNTWVRFLIGYLLKKQMLDFLTIEKTIPGLFQNSDSELQKIKSPRFIKSHFMSANKYPKVLYIIRDPRDVAISFYYWRMRHNSEFSKSGTTLQEYLEQFVVQEVAYRNWDEHVNFWLDEAKNMNDNFKLIRYEDLKQNCFTTVSEMVSFLNINCSPEDIQNAIRLTDLKNMRKAEQKNRATRKSKVPFCRKGTSGQWRDIFPAELNDKYCQKFGHLMDLFNYSHQ